MKGWMCGRVDEQPPPSVPLSVNPGTISDLNNGFGDCRMDSPPSYPSSPRRKEPWKAFITSPSEKLWCIHNATGGELPLASSSRCSASRRTNGRSASDVTPDVRKQGGGLGMIERPQVILTPPGGQISTPSLQTRHVQGAWGEQQGFLATRR